MTFGDASPAERGQGHFDHDAEFAELPAFARPIDPEESRRIQGRRIAKRWIEPLILVWFVSHVTPYLLLIFFASRLVPGSLYGRIVLVLLGAMHLFSFFASAAVAVVTVRNWSSLSLGWTVAGCFPGRCSSPNSPPYTP